MPATVQRLEYDPNRSAFIALVKYEDGELRYILAPVGLKAGDHGHLLRQLRTSSRATACRIANIPVGTVIHNIELQPRPRRTACPLRRRGCAADGEGRRALAQVRLPSGEVRYVRMNCTACIGQVGNIDHGNVHIGKAGRKRHMGIRPTVRGSVMNPNDHPARRRRRPCTCWPSRSRHSVGQACYGPARPARRRTRPTSSSSSAAMR